MHAALVGFGLGFLVALQLGPMSLLLIRSTLRRGWRTGGSNLSTTTGVLGGTLTGFPHFRQNSASSGSVAPHLAHPSRTLASGGVVLLDDILTALRA